MSINALNTNFLPHISESAASNSIYVEITREYLISSLGGVMDKEPKDAITLVATVCSISMVFM